MGSQIASALADDVLLADDFLEPAILLQFREGSITDGQWETGDAVETAIQVVAAPLTGQDRMTLPEGIRDEDLRKFWYRGDVTALRYGLADGDLIIPGKLGATPNSFTSTSLTTGRAEP